ncbi:hypothetical protein DFH11DRAFT_1300037 [Phellopilus nigrolimitatus]|nr:hypothetical protein DFH11DRAFT_1300037 [Phellopilus nigrolimitatus]
MKTPVQKFPVELLNSIFQYCLPQKFGPDSAPLVLAQVCQQWRQVTLENHELWAKLYIDNHAVRRRNTLDLLDIWLKRSGRRLIDVNIDFSISGGNTKTFTLEQYHKKQRVDRKLLSLLYRHSSHTRSFQGILSPSLASEYPIHKMKLLEVLHLTGESECSLSSLPSLALLTQIPTLRHLSLQDVGLDLRSLHSQTQLTRLELSGCNPSGLGPHTAIDLLNALPDLQVVYLALDHSDGSEHRPTLDRLRLPALRHLYISWNWADTVDSRYLLGQFYAPHLERLALKGTLQEMTGIWDALLLFILASDSPSLTHLAIGDIGATDVSLLDVLRVTPSLTHLTVNHALVHPHLLQALVWDVHKPEAQLVPRLTSLRFGACEDFEASDILPVLQSRSGTSIASPEGVSCLEEVDLRQCSGLRREDEKYILATGIRKIALDTEETLLSPFGGLFHFLRFEESHHDFFVD